MVIFHKEVLEEESLSYRSLYEVVCRKFSVLISIAILVSSEENVIVHTPSATNSGVSRRSITAENLSEEVLEKKNLIEGKAYEDSVVEITYGRERGKGETQQLFQRSEKDLK